MKIKLAIATLGLCSTINGAFANEGLIETPAVYNQNQERAEAIVPTNQGLAKELSDQAKVVADLEERLRVAEQKISRIIKVLKLKRENGK